MSVAGSQQRTFLSLVGVLRPHWRADRAMPLRIENELRSRRAIGSRDRRLYRELLYTTLRYLPWIEPLLDRDTARAVKIAAWLAAESKATSAFRAAICADWPARPATLAKQAQFLEADASALLPAWFREHCPRVFEPAELETQLRRAPLWLRATPDGLAAIEQEFAQLGWRFARSEALPTALRLFADADVTKTESFARGLVEVQDLGSQLVLAQSGIEPGGRWLDACAGAGGKTLQLAQLAAHVDAHDVRAAALAELATRASRAGLTNISLLREPPAAAYDGVLVDAPCSGSGTWRRAPHLKWTTTPETVAEHAVRQLKILSRLAARVRPGGRLLYATCSLSRRENEEVVAQFLAAQPEFAADPAHPPRTLLPAQHDSDGFFAAALRRR
jgi:16S rRNA (cytosine967-C5)-methyltransferase